MLWQFNSLHECNFIHKKNSLKCMKCSWLFLYVMSKHVWKSKRNWCCKLYKTENLCNTQMLPWMNISLMMAEETLLCQSTSYQSYQPVTCRCFLGVCVISLFLHTAKQDLDFIFNEFKNKNLNKQKTKCVFILKEPKLDI